MDFIGVTEKELEEIANDRMTWNELIVGLYSLGDWAFAARGWGGGILSVLSLSAKHSHPQNEKKMFCQGQTVPWTLLCYATGPTPQMEEMHARRRKKKRKEYLFHWYYIK